MAKEPKIKPLPGMYQRSGDVWWCRKRFKGVEKEQFLNTETNQLSLAIERVGKWLERYSTKRWADYDHNITFRQSCDVFVARMDEGVSGLAKTSITRYKDHVNSMVAFWRDTKMVDIDVAAVAAYWNWRSRQVTLRKKRVAPATVRRELMCLSAIYKAMRKEGKKFHNPVPEFMSDNEVPKGQARRRYLSHNEEGLLLDRCLVIRDQYHHKGDSFSAGMMDRLHLSIVLAIDTGLRKEEQFSMRWENVHFTRNLIFVPAGETNRDRDREVPLWPRALDALRKLKDLAGDSPWVFPSNRNDTGHMLGFRSDEGAFKKAVDLAGIKDIEWHDLRRTCGCRLLQDHGAEISQVSKWLGHSSTDVTEKHYAFLEIQHLQRIVERSPIGLPAQSNYSGLVAAK